MSEATNTKLMDTSPGGENTQYESSATFTKPHAKSKGQFGGIYPFLDQPSQQKLIRCLQPDETTTEATQQAQEQKKERGEKTVENIRFGESISEHGFGGETVGNSGDAQGGSAYGRVEREAGEGGQGQTRREQGYGGGNGVGG